MTTSATPATPIDPTTIETRLFINNAFVESSSNKTFPTVNPATGGTICEVHEASVDDVNKAVAAAKKAFELGSEWRSSSGAMRRTLMTKFADLVERDINYLAELESLDNGKPVGRAGQYGSLMDFAMLVEGTRYYAGWADKITGKTIPLDTNDFCYTRKEPVGVVAAIIPWNFPALMWAWKVMPALACGCTCVVKTSEKTPLSAIHLCKLAAEAGFPAGVINTIAGFGPTTGNPLSLHPDVDKVAFTGSGPTGRKIMEAAAKSNLKNVTLELGGKSPLIVCDDADLEKAIEICHWGIFLNAGQVCCASSRIYVQSGIYDKFVEAAVKKAKTIKLGPATDDDAQQGPQVDKIQFDRVMDYIAYGKAQDGATCMTGGCQFGNKGYFIEPTVFTDVKDDMKIAKEEIFGPVLSVFKFETDEEAVARANNTAYGLAAGVLSENPARALGLAHQLRAGTVWVNRWGGGVPYAPFGGFKESGHGRDNGEEGLEKYLETKTVVIPLDGPKC